MTSTKIKSCNNYVFSHKDVSKKTLQHGFYGGSSLQLIPFVREYNSLIDEYIGTAIGIKKKF